MSYEIHISDVRQFKTCRRRWNWSSPLRRRLEPAIPYMPFFTGRAVHHALEMYYSDGIPLLQSLDHFLQNERQHMGALWPQEEEKIQEQIDLLVGMIQHYGLWIESEAQLPSKWADSNLDFIALETEFSVPIRTPSGRASPRVFLAGRMDGVVRLKDDGSVWLWEVKTSVSIQGLKDSLANDPQAGAYILAARELFDVEPRGVLYNIMRKKIPTKPEILKSGLLTRRKNIDTTADAYLEAVREHHPDWTRETIYQNYFEILQHLLDKGNTFFARYPVSRYDEELDQLQRDLHTVSLEMVHPWTPIYPNESWINCNKCPFRTPCLAMNSGGDVEFILENEYAERTRAVSWRQNTNG